MAKKLEDMSEVDLAYKILTDAGKDHYVHYRDLILDILQKKNKSTQNEAAAISPEQKKWGLTEWDPPETKKRGATRTKLQDKSDEMME